MIINTKNKPYALKGKYDPPRTSSILSSYSQVIVEQDTKTLDN
jgi:hypothetical protein